MGKFEKVTDVKSKIITGINKIHTNKACNDAIKSGSAKTIHDFVKQTEGLSTEQVGKLCDAMLKAKDCNAKICFEFAEKFSSQLSPLGVEGLCNFVANSGNGFYIQRLAHIVSHKILACSGSTNIFVANL